MGELSYSYFLKIAVCLDDATFISLFWKKVAVILFPLSLPLKQDYRQFELHPLAILEKISSNFAFLVLFGCSFPIKPKKFFPIISSNVLAVSIIKGFSPHSGSARIFDDISKKSGVLIEVIIMIVDLLRYQVHSSRDH